MAECAEGDGNAYQKQAGRKGQDKIDKERIKVRKDIPAPAGEDKDTIHKRGDTKHLARKVWSVLY